MMAVTETLESALVEAARLDMRDNPFIAALSEGRCSMDVIRRYGAGVFALAEMIGPRLQSIASRCDDPDVRMKLLENLSEEEGHPNLAARFARAAGATGSDLDAAAAAMRPKATWLNAAVNENRIAAAIAYLTVGVEGNVPQTMLLVTDALTRHYGFSAHDIEFFTTHIEADEGHAQIGLQMTTRLVRNDADRAGALEGARRGASAWWWFHRSMVR